MQVSMNKTKYSAAEIRQKVYPSIRIWAMTMVRKNHNLKTGPFLIQVGTSHRMNWNYNWNETMQNFILSQKSARNSLHFSISFFPVREHYILMINVKNI